MLNSSEFTKRLQKVIDYYEESASSFAENIGVQRSSISHILSGRNKPSLDFVMKILHSYPEVELYWLLNGKGKFPSEQTSEQKQPELKTPHLFENQAAETKPDPISLVSKSNTEPNSNLNLNSTPDSNSDSEIDSIVFFYKNGSFKSYKP